MAITTKPYPLHIITQSIMDGHLAVVVVTSCLAVLAVATRLEGAHRVARHPGQVTLLEVDVPQLPANKYMYFLSFFFRV